MPDSEVEKDWLTQKGIQPIERHSLFVSTLFCFTRVQELGDGYVPRRTHLREKNDLTKEVLQSVTTHKGSGAVSCTNGENMTSLLPILFTAADGFSVSLKKKRAEVEGIINKLTHDNFPYIGVDNIQELDGLKNKTKEEWFDFAKRKVQEVGDSKIKDPLGDDVYLLPGSTETFDEYIIHLIAGMNQPIENAKLGRVMAVSLLKKTIESPQAIVLQEPRDEHGEKRKVYLSVYNLYGKMAQSVIVGVERGQEGRVITSFATVDSKKDKTAAFRDFKKKVLNAAEVKFLDVDPSGHPRSTAQLDGSTDDAALSVASKNKVSENETEVNTLGEKISEETGSEGAVSTGTDTPETPSSTSTAGTNYSVDEVRDYPQISRTQNCMVKPS